MNNPARLPAFKDWVPDGLRLALYIFFLVSFQFSNGMYFASMSEMVGTLSITPDDTKMMGNAVLVGLTMFFTLAFRLKFRFPNQTCLMVAALGLLLCNLVVPHLQSVPLLVLVCYAAGFLRLWGTFECFSNLLPRITPTYNYAVFLSFVFFVVLGVIHLFDIASTYITFYYSWHHVHHLAVALLLCVAAMAYLFMRPFRAMPKMPLYGIDWLGMILWSIFILSLIFVVQYGVQLDWLNSPHIRVALGASCLALAANVWRMAYTRHPFLALAAFRTRNLLNLLILFLLLDILLSGQTVLQNTYTSAFLHLDQLSSTALDWYKFVGMALGALFSWQAITRLKFSHKLLTFVGMAMVVVYLAMVYFLITPYTNVEKLYLPQVCCGFGQVSIFIALTVYAQATAPFKNYFQVITILGLIRTGIAAPLGEAIYTHALDGLISKRLAAIGTSINPSVPLPHPDLAALFFGNDALLAPLQKLFGWSVVLGIAVLIAVAASRFKKHVRRPIPKFF
ncbi:MAG: hypothetical protein LBS94_03390 [Prevotellaceae bacterium]|jgi:hypothetical protein|nr:hypothetical protein [Prevotellaceae bacterium]